MREKADALTAKVVGNTTPPTLLSDSEDNEKHHHHHHIHLPDHRAHRLNRIHHPTGKIFHIVHHPHEIETKRAELSKTVSQESTADFDIIIDGSPEHVAAIREVHEHNLGRRETIRRKNAELFDEFDEIHDTLGHLNDELHRLTTSAVALDASFDKFGYSAHLRTTDDDNSSLHSTNSSAEARHKDRSIEPIRFWKTPTVRQYFHKGLLWRSSRSGEVGSFELFTDLIYVGVVDIIGETAVTHASSESFLHFVVVFALGYKIWNDLTVMVNWFEVEDICGRLVILFILCCLFGFNSNIEFFFEGTQTPGMSYYLTQRFLCAAFFVLTSYIVKMIRGTLLLHAGNAVVSGALYIAALHVSYPYSLILYFIGLFIDYFGGVALMMTIRKFRAIAESRCQKPVSRLIRRNFEFFPAINIEHRVERTNSFTTLVFGYSVLKCLYQSRAHIGFNAFLGKGMLAIIQAFAIMWLYFDIDNWAVHVHAIRRHWLSSSLYIFCHLPLSASFILASSTLSVLVLAHDCTDANAEDLAESYAAQSESHVSQPLRWFYCAGLGTTLLCMTVISCAHIHKRIKNPRVGELKRRTYRVAVSIIMICLPLADSLNSLDLIAITTSLIVFVLILDIYGHSCPGEEFWTGGRNRRKECKYVAKMKMSKRRKAELQKRFAEGGEVTLSDALARSRTDSMDSQETLVMDEEWSGGHV